MSGIYYTREPGADGQILSGEDGAAGAGLDQLLELDRPPLRAALEIGSAVADILCIASEDGHVHGDIRPAHVKVDESGAVSIEGYGIVRRVTRAPEGRPDLPPADIYGLGLVMHASLSKEGMGTLPNDADGHDDAVIERVLAMDFSAVAARKWLAEVREFLCKILAFDPGDRPPALDAANVLASVAGQCPGDDVATWAKRAHLRLAGGRPPARQVQENLGGPVAVSGYFKKGDAGRDAARKAPSSKGESTAMWSREKLAAMFAEDEDDEPSRPSRPAPSPRKEELSAPRPLSPAMPAAPPRAPAAPPEVARPQLSHAEPPARPPTASPSRPQPAAPPARPSVVQPQYGNNAGISAGVRSRAVSEPEPEEKGSNTMLILGVGFLLLVVVCAGFSLLGGGGYFFMSTQPTATTDTPATTTATTTDPAAVLADPAAPANTPSAAPASATPKPATPTTTKPTTTTSPATASPTTTTKPTTTSKPATTTPTAAPVEPAAAPATAPASTVTTTTTYPVKFTAPGREGKVRCGDGQVAEFTGATTLNFSGTVTCLVQIGQGRGAVQIGRSTTVTCSEDSGKVSCTGGS